MKFGHGTGVLFAAPFIAQKKKKKKKKVRLRLILTTFVASIRTGLLSYYFQQLNFWTADKWDLPCSFLCQL